jgi:uncharacterized membrane protein YdbT with pleckstrin-like domain
MAPYSYHPYPIMSVTTAIGLAVVIGVLAFFFQDILGDLYLPLLSLAILYALVRIAYAYAIARTYSVTLDDNEIVFRFGIWKRNEYVLPYNKITEARFSQTIPEQAFNIGTLSVDTPGYTDLPMRLNGVRMPDILKTLDTINIRTGGVRVKPRA